MSIDFKEKFENALREKFNPGELGSMWRILKEDYLDTHREWTDLESEFDDFISRLLRDEPIQYLVSNARFLDYDFFVDQSVLIPRLETEELVVWIKSELAAFDRSLKILDIGTGSGCIIISLALADSQHEFYGIDISEAALQVAQKNSNKLGSNVQFQNIDFRVRENWSSLGNYDIIISNPPYVGRDEEERVSQSALDYEPAEAIFSEDDPLHFYKLISEFGKTHLKASGKLFLELNEYYPTEIQEIFHNNDWKTEMKKDLQGKWRMLSAKR